MSKYLYKDKEYDIKTGPRGGNYIILASGKKVYIKCTNKELDKPIESEFVTLEYEVPDPEHEGDIEHEINYLNGIAPITVSYIEREYSEDGEEIVYAMITFKCKRSDYSKFKSIL